MAAVATVATAVATTAIGSTRATAAAITTAAAIATVTSNGHLLTAQQGNADDREENRDAKNKSTIHPKTSTNRYRNVRSKNTNFAVVIPLHPTRDGYAWGWFQLTLAKFHNPNPFTAVGLPWCKPLRITQVGSENVS